MSFLTSNQPPFVSSHSVNSTAVSTGLSECHHIVAGVRSTLIFLTLPPHINPMPPMPVLSQHLLWSKTPLARVGAPPSEPTGKQSLAVSPRSLSISRASLCSLPQAFVASVPKGGIREGISEEVPELQPKSMSLMSFCPVQSLGNIRAQISHTRQAWRGQAFGKARLNVLCDGNEKFPNSLRVQHRGPHHTSTLTVVTEQRDNRALRVLLKLVMLRGQKLHLHCIEKGA